MNTFVYNLKYFFCPNLTNNFTVKKYYYATLKLARLLGAQIFKLNIEKVKISNYNK